MLKLSLAFLLVALAVNASARPEILLSPGRSYQPKRWENELENGLEEEFENELESAQPNSSKSKTAAKLNEDYYDALIADDTEYLPQDVSVVNDDSNEDVQNYTKELNELIESIKKHIAELKLKVEQRRSLVTNEA